MAVDRFSRGNGSYFNGSFLCSAKSQVIFASCVCVKESNRVRVCTVQAEVASPNRQVSRVSLTRLNK